MYLGQRGGRTLPLALRPVNQMVTPFWPRRRARSAASTEPARHGQCVVHQAKRQNAPAWKVMFVDIFADEQGQKEEEAGGWRGRRGRRREEGEGTMALRPPLRAAGPYKYISST